MRKLLLFLALCALPAEAQTVCPGASTGDAVMGREAITVAGTAIGFTATVYAPSGGPTVSYAIVTLETADIRVSADGIPPTSTVGELYSTSTNVKFAVCGQTNVRRFLAIRTGSSAAITAVYYAKLN